ncbi:hypothetical protein Q2K19_24235 [Micromonospora soli]|uniref:hypothetical protein n=1 Tax=Micromonospora sp. NBRC 110009 TaxID=3061627 RepID=UPI0026722670|nr:hypothetical protein [Micromonospora sp. NBRC 110009]WKT97260.1 hypothetical protein Q2K19_24235 [Micromonospora sp. NBRC 110009]
MGNSAVYRIHTGDDLGVAYAMAQRLLAHRSIGCRCPQDALGRAETNTHDLGRYLGIGPAYVSLSIPARLLGQLRDVLEPHLPPDDRPSQHRDGSGYLITDMTTEVVAALRQLPPIGAMVSTPEYPLPSTSADAVLAAAGTNPAWISWQTCWPSEHNRCGFELAINGAELWHAPAPAGHSVYVHVHPAQPELAHALAAAVGGQVMGAPALGW